MPSPTEARVLALFAALLDPPLERPTLEANRETLPAWNAMGHLTLLLELEQEFGISLAPEAVEKMLDVAAVVRPVEAACG